jgi:hypothetical protein
MEKLTEHMAEELLTLAEEATGGLIQITECRKIAKAWREAGLLALSETAHEKARREWEDTVNDAGCSRYCLRARALKYISELTAEIDRLKNKKWDDADMLEFSRYCEDRNHVYNVGYLFEEWTHSRRAAKAKE